MSLTSGGVFPFCALNIRCTVTGDFVSASHRTHWAFSYIEAIFKPAAALLLVKNSKLKTPIWKVNEFPSLPAAKCIQLVSLLRNYTQLKSG
jgi:hypothetical protein